MSQKYCSYVKILRTGFNRSINAACSRLPVQGSFIPRCCCDKYLGCLSYFIAFKVYNREDIRQVSFLDNITDSQTELKSLTCINRRFLVLPPLMCYGPSYQLFVESEISFIFHNKLLKVCRFE